MFGEFFWFLRKFVPSGHGQSLDYNREFGRFRVVYPDGMKSQPFCYDVAKSYRNIFGGEIERITK